MLTAGEEALYIHPFIIGVFLDSYGIAHLPPNKKFNTITDVPCQTLAFVKKEKATNLLLQLK